MKFSGSIYIINEIRFFYSHWVLYNFASCTTNFHLILFAVSLPFSAFLLLQAYSPSRTPHLWRAAPYIAKNSDSNKAQKLPWKLMDSGCPFWARKARNFCRSWNTRSKTFSLDKNYASAWYIISLRLLPCLCTRQKTFDACLSVSRWNSQFFDLIKN